MKPFRPQLAEREVPRLDAIKYPKLASPKYDGIRAVRPLGDVRLHTRKLKLVPNILVRELFCHKALDGVDGELIVGEPNDPLCYNKTESIVMSYAPPKTPNGVRLFLFDHFANPGWDYERRLALLRGAARAAKNAPIVVVEQRLIRNASEALEYESEMVELGYEGIMLRDPRGYYKFGRTTMNEEILLKIKRFRDSEAYVTGFEEQQANNNQAAKSELGYMKRSKKQEGMVGKDTLGVILGHDPVMGWDVRVGMGPGLTDELRAEIWANRSKLLAKKTFFKYRYQPAGTKDKPRSPRFVGWRKKEDM